MARHNGTELQDRFPGRLPWMYPATVPPHTLVRVGVLQKHVYQVPCSGVESDWHGAEVPGTTNIHVSLEMRSLLNRKPMQLNFRAAPGHNPSVLSPQATEVYWWGNSQSPRENMLFPDQQENATEDPHRRPHATATGSREFTGQQQLLSLHPDSSVLWLVALLYTEQSSHQLLQSENLAHVQKAVLLLCVQVVFFPED